jgi:hypothetical protein
MKNFLRALGLVAIAFGGVTAQATPVDQWVIIEGQGLTDNAVYLGQPRTQLVQRSKACKKPATQCTFRIEPSVQDITVFFNAKNKVERIQFTATELNFNGEPLKGFTWSTSRGLPYYGDAYLAHAYTYPGSTYQCIAGSGCIMDSPKDGLRFIDRNFCAELDCVYNGTLEVYRKQP